MTVTQFPLNAIAYLYEKSMPLLKKSKVFSFLLYILFYYLFQYNIIHNTIFGVFALRIKSSMEQKALEYNDYIN